MYDAGASELNRDQTLYVFATSQSWDEGDGKFSDTPQGENGVSWRYRTADTGSQWGHIDSGSWGSTYFSGSEYTASQTFNKNDDIDMRMDVTNIVNHWISGSISNEGFLITTFCRIVSPIAPKPFNAAPSSANFPIIFLNSGDTNATVAPVSIKKSQNCSPLSSSVFMLNVTTQYPARGFPGTPATLRKGTRTDS